MDKIFKFYKYQSLSEEKHFTYLENYLNQRVWVTPLKKLNDPFEGHHSLVPYTPETILSNSQLFYEVLKRNHLNGNHKLTADQLRKHLNSKINFQNSLNINTKMGKFETHGALCLTRKDNDPTMWAYYADDHKGYCVEFGLDSSVLCKSIQMSPDKIDDYINNIISGAEILMSNPRAHRQFFIFTKVRYRKKIPSVVSNDFVKLADLYDQIKYIVANSVGVKSTAWEHEDEFRLLVNGNSEECGLLPLGGLITPYLKVTGIVIGAKMEEGKRKRVHDLCQQNSKIKLYNATYSRSTYEIVREEST